MLQISPQCPVTHIAVQGEVPASQHVAFHIHLFSLRSITSSRLWEERFPESFGVAGHVQCQFAASVSLLLILISAELCGHQQTKFKLHRQFFPVSEPEQQRLAVIQQILNIIVSRSSKLLLPLVVRKGTVCQMALESQPSARTRDIQIIPDVNPHLGYRTRIRSFHHGPTAQRRISFQRKSPPFLASDTQPERLPCQIRISLLHHETHTSGIRSVVDRAGQIQGSINLPSFI